MKTAVGEFLDWLPGELKYSARKAGYDKKIERAKLPTTDPRSMYGFLATEWSNHQVLKSQGAHYKSFHGMSAQLQLAKFAAGLFDKAALANWLIADSDATQANFATIAERTAAEAADMLPARRGEENVVSRPFDETLFAYGVTGIMEATVRTVELTGPERIKSAEELRSIAIDLGGVATNCYIVYAHEHLTPDQYTLPASEPAG